ncbi:DUF1871 family protein [Exiguobacterium algae]|uniref:DUF1871 family protein n=1 Tax=Exiguobacterium algae TaxID=2751250 RepID=UPI001BE86873
MRTEDLLLAWDPLGYGCGSYGPEFDDILLALTYTDSVDQLHHLIRQTLLDSFGDCPNEQETHKMAVALLKSSSSCQL